MRKIILFHLFLCTAMCLSAMTGPAAAATSSSVNIQDIAHAEMFRYGRELYRKGDYAKAADVFKKILKSDCNNTLAQYHLQKIAQKGPEYQYLMGYLKSLPCPVYDFTNADFLPASFYYEKDKDLLLEQMSTYTQRYRAMDNAVSTQMTNYESTISDLEQKVSALNNELDQLRANNTDKISVLRSDFEEKERLCREMDNQIARLKDELAAARASKQTEINAMEVKLNEIQAQANMAAKNTAAASQAWEERLAKENALRQLNTKELELKAKNRELTTLQEKFADVQGRLDMIERELKNRNIQIQNIRKDLQTIQE